VQIATAADAAVERALERGGARLVTKASRNAEIKDRLRSIDKSKALTMVTEKELLQVGLTSDALLEGAWDALAAKTKTWVRDFLSSSGVEPMIADDAAALASSNVCNQLHEYVSGRLHDGLPVQSNGLRVSDDLIVKSLKQVVSAV
jgi:hypothetical protein